jgi:hypothetical protein
VLGTNGTESAVKDFNASSQMRPIGSPSFAGEGLQLVLIRAKVFGAGYLRSFPDHSILSFLPFDGACFCLSHEVDHIQPKRSVRDILPQLPVVVLVYQMKKAEAQERFSWHH